MVIHEIPQSSDASVFLIRRAISSEQKELESLQLRASLTNAGDRDALLANPDAIELPLDQITSAQPTTLRDQASSTTAS